MTTNIVSKYTSSGDYRKNCYRRKDCRRPTWHNIASIQRILILDEAETIHQLYLCDLTSAMFRKVSLDIGLGSCR